jgi:crossover junction endodeoxyribonuclease RuvC
VYILGIDPGYHRCGYAVLDEAQAEDGGLRASGVMITARGEPLAERLHHLAGQFDELLHRWEPRAVALEQIYFTKNAKTAIGVAQARGVLLERTAAAGLAVAEYAPTMVKSQLTGNGRASKEQVAYMVRKLTGLSADKRLDDELDAIAVALCHLQRASIPEVLR